jgi:hypothetical protein
MMLFGPGVAEATAAKIRNGSRVSVMKASPGVRTRQA